MRATDDLLALREVVDRFARAAGLTAVDRTKLVTAATEVARNAVVHADGGDAEVALVTGTRGRSGVRVHVQDDGPGIADPDAALADGFSTRGGLGLGLGGARRLANEFDLRSGPTGTAVTLVRWG